MVLIVVDMMLLTVKFGNYDTTIRDTEEDALGIRSSGTRVQG